MNCSWRRVLALLAVLLAGGAGEAEAAGCLATDSQRPAATAVPEASAGTCEGEADDEAAAEKKRKEYIRGVLSKSPATGMQGRQLARAGSGFFVAEDGVLVTNYRLVDGCGLISVSPTFGEMAIGIPIATDSSADLALLRADLAPPGIASFVGSEGALKNEPAYVIGYPSLGQATTEPTLTRVEVLGSQTTTFSVSTIVIKGEVRTGYNGGALLDGSGGVIGAVLANTTQTYAATGGNVDAVGLVLPSEALRTFLDEQGIGYEVGMKLPPKSWTRIRIDARPFMAQIGCWQ